MAKKQGFKLFGFIIAIIAVTDIAILWDIPILRQIFGVLFLTILPGLLILFLFRLNKLGIAEKIVLAIGLSIAFLMFYGWLLNQACLFLGYTSPLSTNALVLWLSLALIALLVTAYIRNKEAFASFPFSFELNTKGKLCLLLPVTFPLLSIWGMRLLNTSDSNIILLALLFLIPVSIIVITFLKREISKDTYPIAIIMTAAAIALMFWLRSEHILGDDIHYEYYLSRMTLLNQHWSIIDYGPADAMLSITLLPAIYQSLLQMQGEEYLFQGIYALIWIVTPLTVYIIARKYIGEPYAFLASFLFISQTMFLAGDARIRPAIFFFALVIMVLFHDKIRGAKQRGLFIAFMAATIVSHYSTTYVFFLLLLFTWLLRLVLKKYIISPQIALTSVCLFLVLIFLWYSQLTQASFEAGVGFFNQIIRNLSDFAVAEAREPNVRLLLGSGIGEKIILTKIQFAITWLTFAFIAMGVVGTLIKRKEMLSAPPWRDSPSGWLSSRLETEHFLLAAVASLILAISIAVPYVSTMYGGGRLYGQMLVILSPFYVIGGVILAKYCRLNPHWLILPVLILYFLFATSAIHEVSGVHRATHLSSKSPTCDYELVHPQETQAARWAKEHIEANSLIYADGLSRYRLASQGKISLLGLTRQYGFQRQEVNGYCYLSYNNVVNGKWLLGYEFYDLSDLHNIFSGKNKLYASNGSEIWR